ncbi:DNA gyrase subunit B, mitochondrial [Gracilariopsis chorda]|uniref:DNA gyrase subunit B n=1 Tax=Gracilariopsis chorda TaxID=448386 RepID=A0A2V3J2B6_9FLOR|nr:DNA gyrase subunit B, mitochondrial [Gracilariopsis chorda]|eukprot:PXF48519.1 DNA gyrase subunit B, mitochondrial [Gracilariopsis chorda]
MHSLRPAFISCLAYTRRRLQCTPNAFIAPRRLPRARHVQRQTIRLTASSPPATQYGASDITVLEGLEPVRMRPGMYIGSTGSKGLHHLVFEVIDNAVDESLAGFCKTITVTLHADGSVSVRDDGRGIPTDKHPATGKSALETVMTVLHSGGKFGGAGYTVSGGLHGVGVSVVNALSERLDVNVWREGRRHSMTFSRGEVLEPLEECDDTNQASGTHVRFLPDNQIFTTSVQFDLDVLSQRLEELAFLNAGLEIVITRESDSESRHFLHHGGISEYVASLSSSNDPLHKDPATIFFSGEKKGVTVEVAMRWNADSYTDKLIGFANNIRTGDGGTHMEGLRASLTRSINQLARKAGKLRDHSSNIGGEYIREGLTAIVSVKVPNPEFEGQTKSRLGNPEVRSTVDSIVARSLIDFFELKPNILASIVDKALSASAAADAARRARDIVRRKTVLENSTLPGKLADCASRDPSVSEIFIVEGESAGGSAKQARDRRYQAILPLRGKILNIEKTDDAKIYQNTEIQALITALGLGIRGDEFSTSQLRYHRIIIMTDADVDGAHIRTLLLTFFFRYRRALIENGFVYIACPPLYKIDRRQKSVFLYSDEELQEYVEKKLPPNARYTVQRFKGLGEMMPGQLWNTTMNPGQRQLKRVEIEDAILADQVFTVLMGHRVGPRRAFIESHAAALSIEDIDF